MMSRTDESQAVIEAKNLSVAYKVYERPMDVVREALFGRQAHDKFWALRDVSLSVGEGERVGIVGPNGAGKSTLLQVIANKLTPSRGTVSVNGNISSLLSMVPAWNLEESGIDNIKNNLLMRGVPGGEIPALVEEIIDFCEIGQFIFQPVKTYSTGMGARLSFAIATATNPDILIVDEVLGTGDGYFASKAMKRMHEFCDRGRALLFVSHAVSSVQQMCDRVIWLQNGSVRLDGEAGYVLKQYELDYREAEDVQLRAGHSDTGKKPTEATHTSQLMDENFLFLRLVSDSGAELAGTHFVQSISYDWEGTSHGEVPLELTDTASEETDSALELLNGEWGRLHERKGVMCRILTRATGREAGGMFSIRVPRNLLNQEADLNVAVRSESTHPSEHLTLEYLDVATGAWLAGTPIQPVEVNSEFQEFVSSARYAPVAADVRQKAVEKVSQDTRPIAEIVGVELVSEGRPQLAVDERTPFEIHVKTEFNTPVAVADVGIKITRSDGVYVFWQSSGQSGGNLENASGQKTFKFKFDPNVFGAGEYSVNAHITNGWDFPRNYPYSHVYARGIDILKFKVFHEFRDLDFGVLNVRAEVEVVNT